MLSPRITQSYFLCDEKYCIHSFCSFFETTTENVHATHFDSFFLRYERERDEEEDE